MGAPFSASLSAGSVVMSGGEGNATEQNGRSQRKLQPTVPLSRAVYLLRMLGCVHIVIVVDKVPC